jgi:hypothetical protein
MIADARVLLDLSRYIKRSSSPVLQCYCRSRSTEYTPLAPSPTVRSAAQSYDSPSAMQYSQAATPSVPTPCRSVKRAGGRSGAGRWAPPPTAVHTSMHCEFVIPWAPHRTGREAKQLIRPQEYRRCHHTINELTHNTQYVSHQPGPEGPAAIELLDGQLPPSPGRCPCRGRRLIVACHLRLSHS